METEEEERDFTLIRPRKMLRRYQRERSFASEIFLSFSGSLCFEDKRHRRRNYGTTKVELEQSAVDHSQQFVLIIMSDLEC